MLICCLRIFFQYRLFSKTSFRATIGIYIVMGTGVMGPDTAHQPPGIHSISKANSTANKRQAVGAAPELVSEDDELSCLPASLWRQPPKPLFGSQESFLPVAREPSSLTFQMASEPLLGA